MALGPYNSATIGETKLDNLLSSYNAAIGSGTDLNATLAEEFINLRLFQDSLFVKVPYQSDTMASATSLTAGTHLFFEYGSTGSDTLDFTTNGDKSVIVLGASAAMNFDDLGSTGDKGDVIVGSDVNQFIEVTQGNNFVVAGDAQSFLQGGSGKDTLVGGGHTSIMAGSGAESLVGGASKSSSDTLVGGAGADTMSVTKGDNVIVSGSGTDSIYSADKGVGGTGGDSISLVGGGSANVSIGAGGATDSVYFGGTTGDDSIVAKGTVDVLVQSTEVLTKVDTAGGTTTLSFKDGQTLTYSGSGHVTVNFNGF
jgi:Ca2+-binding RTX toxin-like protein